MPFHIRQDGDRVLLTEQPWQEDEEGGEDLVDGWEFIEKGEELGGVKVEDIKTGFYDLVKGKLVAIPTPEME